MMTIERLTELLDAYGAQPERWPDGERTAMRALLERSAEARAHLAAAADLDALLDRAVTAAPAPDLAARILAAAPRRTTVPRQAGRRSWPRLAAVPLLAAAAGLALWLVREPPRPATLAPEVVARLGALDVPTDDLLSSAELGLDDETPSFGCDDPALGCDELDAPPAQRSGRRPIPKEMPA
jgi:hypothetical protein